MTRHLEKRAEAYCARNPGIHIEVFGYTEEQFADRIARGVYPDAYSFQTGLLYAEQLRATSVRAPELNGTLYPVTLGTDVLAVPYLLSGYFLCANAQLLAALQLELPETPDDAFLAAAAALRIKGAPQLYMPPILAARAGITGELAGADAFARGKAALAVLDARALGDLRRDTEANLLVSAVPYGPYTDEVFYLGAASGASDEKAQAIADFQTFLLSDEEQDGLAALGALPVSASSAPVYAERELTALREAYAAPVSPQPMRYHAQRDEMLADALRAIAGDAAAKASFWERMQVVENGEL